MNPTETFLISQQEHERGQVLSEFNIRFKPNENFLSPTAAVAEGTCKFELDIKLMWGWTTGCHGTPSSE